MNTGPLAPLSLAPPLSPAERIAELERLLADLQSRVQALEAQRAGVQPVQTSAHRVPDRLRQINASRRTRCNRLRAAITRIVSESPQPELLTAKSVRRALEEAGFNPVQARRTIADHLRALRGGGETVCRHRNG